MISHEASNRRGPRRGRQLVALCLSSLVLGVSRPGVSHEVDDGDGRAVFMRRCASCHGVSGAGDGPVAQMLCLALPDLTRLRAANDGVFPVERVQASIDGTTELPAHGSRRMPVWGRRFAAEAGPEREGAEASAWRIEALVQYLESIQAEHGTTNQR